MEIFFPISGGICASGTIGSEETDTECGVKGPTTNVNLSTSLIRENDTSGAENVGFDMHLSVGSTPIRSIDQGRIQFISTGGIGGAKTTALIICAAGIEF